MGYKLIVHCVLQAFYNDYLGEGWREERWYAIARQDGVALNRVERALKDKKACSGLNGFERAFLVRCRLSSSASWIYTKRRA